MSNNFSPVQTDAGFAAMINSQNAGQKWRITHISIGDANGVSYVPTVGQTALKNEKMRVAISSSDQFKEGFRAVAEFAYDPLIGAFENREIGFYMQVADEAPTLWAIYSKPDMVVNLMNELTNDYVASYNVIITRGTAEHLVFLPAQNSNRDFNLSAWGAMSVVQMINSATHINHIINNKYKGA